MIASVRTAWVVLRRELKFIFSQLAGRLIDGFIIVTMQTLAIGQFLPLLGMPKSLIGPLYIGTMSQIIFSGAYGIAFRYVSDLQRARFINYQLALPLPKWLLFVQIIIAFMIEVAFISIPLIFAGTLFLAPYFSLAHINWLKTLAMFVLTLLFYSVLFIFLAFNQQYTWFIDNVWARRLSPLFLLGCGYYTWKRLYAFNNLIALALLANPLTYVHEGLRSALLGTDEFLPFWLCIAMVASFCLLFAGLLTLAIRKKLDPV